MDIFKDKLEKIAKRVVSHTVGQSVTVSYNKDRHIFIISDNVDSIRYTKNGNAFIRETFGLYEINEWFKNFYEQHKDNFEKSVQSAIEFLKISEERARDMTKMQWFKNALFSGCAINCSSKRDESFSFVKDELLGSGAKVSDLDDFFGSQTQFIECCGWKIYGCNDSYYFNRILKPAIEQASRLISRNASAVSKYFKGNYYFSISLMNNDKHGTVAMSAKGEDMQQNYLVGESGKLAKYILHEFGHIIMNKFHDKMEKFKNMHATLQNEFNNLLKKGDVVVFEGNRRTRWKIDDVKNEKIDIHSLEDSSIEKKGLSPTLLSNIVSINGQPFSYDKYPSSYSMCDNREFFAECFALYCVGLLKGELKDAMDELMNTIV